MTRPKAIANPISPWEEPEALEPAESMAGLAGANAERLSPTTLARNLKAARQAMGLTLEELAARANVRLASIQSYEGGKVWPPLVHGQLLADALGTRIPLLLGLEATMVPVGRRRSGAPTAEVLATLTEQAEEIAALRRTLELTQSSEKRWMGLAEAVTEGVLLHDGKIVRDVNPRFAELFGYERLDVIGRSILDFMAPASRPLVLKHVKSGTTEPYEIIGVRSDQTSLRLMVTPRRLSNGMRIAAFRVVEPTSL